MNSGELVTRSTVWLALTIYVIHEALSAARRYQKHTTILWCLSAAGCVFFLAHVAAAFHYFYDWSHAVAYADTARQTKEFTGWNSGGGIYLNYLFALIWTSEVAWSATPRGCSPRPAIWVWTVRAFFLLMIFNGAFFFVRGNVRWFGLLLCFSLMGSWWMQAKRSIDWSLSAKSS